MQKQIGITIIVAVLVGAVAFFGGMQYQKSQASTGLGGGQFAQGGQRQGGRFGNRGFGGMATVGKIVASDSNSITVQMQDGSSKIVNLTGSTKIVKTDIAAVSDLAKDTTVAVFGTTNSDGSITAQNVQINPMVRLQRPSGTPTQAQ